MSSRLSYNYAVSGNTDNFVANLVQFFPDQMWKIHCGDMTITQTSENVGSAIARLNPRSGEVVKLESGTMWVLRPLLHALPKMKTVNVNDEVRAKLQPQIDMLLNPEKFTYVNVNQTFDWNLVREFMTLYQEQSDAKNGFAVCIPLPSINKIVYASKYLLTATGFCGGPPSRLSCISIKDGTLCDESAPWMSFDIDDGFADEHNWAVAYELTDAFKAWTARGKVGPIFQ